MKRKSTLPLLLFVSLILLIFCFQNNSFAQVNQNCTLVGQWAKGPCYDVQTLNNIAFFNDGCVLRIADVSDPLSPINLSEIMTPTVINSISVKGDYVFVANIDSGMAVVDVSDLNNPVLVSNFSIRGFESFIAIGNNIAFFSTSSTIHAIDISDVYNPVEVGMITSGGTRTTLDGNYLYVINRREGCVILNIADPQNMIEIGRIKDGSYFYDVAIQGDYAYLAVSDSLLIYDILDRQHPQRTGAIKGRYMSRCIVQNSLAYVAEGPQRRLKIIDISVPSNPVLLGYHNSKINDYLLGLSIQNDFVLGATGNSGVYIIDVSNTSLPKDVSSISTGGKSRDIVVQDDRALIAQGPGGLQVLDVSVPSNPISLGQYATQGFGNKFIVRGDYAFAAYGGLKVFDISNPLNPLERAYLQSSSTFDIALHGNLVFICRHAEGLDIIDVSDPENPVELGNYDTDGYAFGVDVMGDYAYIADSKEGLLILDISNPSNPTEAGVLKDIGYIQTVVLKGNYAFISNTSYTFMVIDVSDVENPTKVGQINIPGANDLNIVGNHVYASSLLNGLFIVDISDPENIFQAGVYNTSGQAWGSFVYNDLIYVADFDGGLSIIDFDETTTLSPIVPTENQSGIHFKNVFPNPNRGGEIYLSYSLAEEESIEITISSLLGSENEILFKGYKGSGYHMEHFNLSYTENKGVFCIRIRSKDQHVVRRFIVQ